MSVTAKDLFEELAVAMSELRQIQEQRDFLCDIVEEVQTKIDAHLAALRKDAPFNTTWWRLEHPPVEMPS